MSLKVARGKTIKIKCPEDHEWDRSLWKNVGRGTHDNGYEFFPLEPGEGETIPEWDNISAGWEEMSQEFLCRSLPGREKSKRQAGRPTAYKTMFMEKHMAHLEAVVIQHGGSQSRE